MNPPVHHLPNCRVEGHCCGGFVSGPCQCMKRVTTTGTGLSDDTSQHCMISCSESKENIRPNAAERCKNMG